MERAFSRVVILTALVAAAPELRAGDTDTGAADTGSLRDQVLKLNEITGKDPRRGQMRLMLKDEAVTKKLIEYADKMTKERPVPLNGDAASLLAELALYFKQYDACKHFFKIYYDDAARLQSPTKFVDYYNGMIDLLFATKKYDEVVKTCKDFMELPGERESPIAREKPLIQERMIQATAKLGKFDDALAMVDELIGDYGELLPWLKLKAEVYREAEKYEDAVKTYNKALDRLEESKDIKEADRARYARVLRYALVGSWSTSIRSTRHPNNSSCFSKPIRTMPPSTTTWASCGPTTT